MDKSKARHDFINNGLRIEVLHKLITESLEKKESLNTEYTTDLEKFLQEQLELLKHIQEL